MANINGGLTDEISKERHLVTIFAPPELVSGRCRMRCWLLFLCFAASSYSALMTTTAPAVAASGRELGTVFRDCSDCPEMVVVPAGKFTMGSSASTTGTALWDSALPGRSLEAGTNLLSRYSPSNI
jgi:hypothetical protein